MLKPSANHAVARTAISSTKLAFLAPVVKGFSGLAFRIPGTLGLRPAQHITNPPVGSIKLKMSEPIVRLNNKTEAKPIHSLEAWPLLY